MFASSSRVRGASEDNQRTVLDKALVECFIGRDSVAKCWQQRTALLNMLEPRDRLRTLGLVRKLELGLRLSWFLMT